MTSARRPFREFDDSHDAESLRLARRVIRGLTVSMRHVVLAPGSRSAPLAYALAEAEKLGAITVHMRIDERSAAFTALGLALSSGEPAGVITTSGTAAGNLLPAVMEADMSGVPLVAITADRPEELHGIGANQATWQQGMFTGRVRDELHLEQGLIASGQLRLEPESRDDMLAAETQTALLLRAATTSTLRSAPGPVHLNIGFRDPLVPAEAPETAGGGARPAIQRWARRGVIPSQERERLYRASRTESITPAEHLGASDLLERLGAEIPGPGSTHDDAGSSSTDSPSAELTHRTLFVLGHGAPPEAVELARSLGHPVLAEPTSGARSSDLGAIPGYRLILQAPQGTEANQLVAQTQRVVVAGRPTLTRPVQRLIARRDLEAVHYAPSAQAWWDRRRQEEALPRRAVADLREIAEFAGRGDADWLHQWEAKGLAAQHALDTVLAQDASEHEAPSSVQAAQFVAETVKTSLLLGSSSVIRDVDLAAVITRAGVDGAGSSWAHRRGIYALRGLAGIDGNLSTAAGLALAQDRRVTALVGDLTFLHDVNALLVPSTERAPNLDLVVINDAGGAIFDQLEHGDVGRRPGQAEAVERLFGTPQTVDFEAIADAYRHEYVYAESLEALGRALAYPEDRLGIRIIEMRTDRSRLRALHERLAQKAAEL
ncbi:2-succinyl-5-enolpyruvyl-6-hydroxy-3-cyclohexene-1-carboxylic-acid synthase [Nesterenkonia flava]|uniref:2-succinyl-5-enolpyruvyl-6-hydroxy-3-cyclohexene-1-carboxylate synthase n=1 Tax=Nesterenkonia flava TaxID=469799 RepID=A0ABU1FR96_9MICC|nr:2-succinyl-5-enolpyruvyl-6-hydroxy-3-cyclohexene-1-carboxylic-acid synthase [Nesterenkonia flava]MDR5711177.1 2-succinyl-5-enolpyruvyl-6-hydroxy-3-cyclohexene-1-carboxylic-acid synthase [Nesterenkonia flava]